MHLCRSYKSFLWKAVTLRITQLSTFVAPLALLAPLAPERVLSAMKRRLGSLPVKMNIYAIFTGRLRSIMGRPPRKKTHVRFFQNSPPYAHVAPRGGKMNIYSFPAA